MLRTRSQVHSQGLLHRAVNIFVINNQGRLLIQRRSQDKDVCPNLWDLSCAEHLKPRETYHQAAKRGLKEELGITVSFLHKLVKISPPYLSRVYLPKQAIHDFEYQELWLLRYSGLMSPAESEISDIKFVPMNKLNARSPLQLTPWFSQALGIYQQKTTY